MKKEQQLARRALSIFIVCNYAKYKHLLSIIRLM